MRLLLFSDLHADRAAAVALARRANDFDALVGAGDFTNVRDTRSLPVCLDVLKATGKPTVLVAGNNESTDELVAACRGWDGCHVLHESAAVVGGVTFYGVGGGIPVTPFGAWSYDFDEAQAAALLAAAPDGCVLVVHSPPKGVVDVSSRGASIGSTCRIGPFEASIASSQARTRLCSHASSGVTKAIAPSGRDKSWALNK